MEYNNRIQEVERIANKYGIPEVLGYEGKFMSKYYEDVIDININERKTGLFPRTGYYKYKSFFIKSFLYFIVTFISAIRVFKYRRLIKIKEKTPKAITYVGGAYKVVKAKDIFEVVPDISIYYFPTAGVNNLLVHIRTFNDKGRPIFIDRFRIIIILEVIRTFTFNYNRLKKFTKEIDRVYGTKMNDLIVVILKSLYFHYHYEAFVKKLVSKKHVWLLEFHSGMEMLSFQDSIKRHRPQDITVHMQHGLMLESSYIEYHNPITDYDIVCGEREVLLLKDKNKYGSILLGFGCPLQSLGVYSYSEPNMIQYDLLVLLTITRPQTNLDLQVAILEKLSFMTSDIRILLRFRPASQEEDVVSLSKYVPIMNVSNGYTLDQDISRSKVVVSLSADALYHCFRFRKKALLIVPQHVVKDFSLCPYDSTNIKLITVDGLDDAIIRKLVSDKGIADYRHDDYVRFNFGNIDTLSFKTDFNAFLKTILS